MSLPRGAREVGIIGGGVMGLCSAYYLIKEGCRVTVIDQGDLQDGCSYGNAGMIVPSHIIPLAAPGMITKGIRWMFNSSSPFYVRPRLQGSLIRWGWLFYRSSTEKKVQYAIPRLRDISRLSKSLYIDLAEEAGFDFGLTQSGLMMLYKTAAAEKEEAETARAANAAGVEAHILSAAEVQRLETEVQVSVKGGVYFPGDAHLNPNLFIKKLLEYLAAKGVKFIRNTEVIDFGLRHEKVESAVTASGSYAFDEIIIACGAWSPVLTRRLHFSLPLQGGKGYSFNLTDLHKNVRIPSLLIEGKVAVTPIGNNLRFGGTMEIAGIDRSVNMHRVKGITDTIPQFYPEIKINLPPKEEVWSGLRPCSPDGLPYIGKLKSPSNITIATGHGMMGLSLGPATGKLVSELITGQTTSMDITAFDPGRFG